MRGLSRTWPFLLGIVIVYLAPATAGLVQSVSGQPAERTAAVAGALWAYLAIFIYPVACMVVGFFAGWRQGAVWALPVLAALLSLPFSLQYLGASTQGFLGALVYAGIYLVFGLLGWFFGWQVHKRQQAERDA